jgi:hypothetical protein
MPALFSAACAVVALGALAACSGSNECCDDVESYMHRFDEIEDDVGEDFEQLDRDLDNSIANSVGLTEETRVELTESFRRGEEILANAVKELEQIEAPAEIASEHLEAIDGYDDFRGSYAVLRAALPRIMSALDLVAAVTGQADAGGRMNRACAALQKRADADGIDVTFECGIAGM